VDEIMEFCSVIFGEVNTGLGTDKSTIPPEDLLSRTKLLITS